MNPFNWSFMENRAQVFPVALGLALEALGVVLILVLGWVLWKLTDRLLTGFRIRATEGAESLEEKKRVETLVRALHYVATVVLAVMTGMMVLARLGISIAPFLATAGVAGIAVGFGAQSLVKDYFTGLVLLMEDQIRQGDVIEVAGKAGVVEQLTLRYVRLRDYEGSVHFIPNGVINTVTNRSRAFAYAVMDVNIALKQDLDRVTEIMRRVGQELRADAVYGPKILEDLEIAGLDQWGETAGLLKCRFKVSALDQGSVRREFLGRMKRMFDRELGVK